MKKYLYIIVPIVAVALCSLFLLTTFDNKVNDLFLRAIPSLTENESVLLINIDDASIDEVGIWPWTRDIMADAIVFLREMGADTVVSDLSYLDISPVKVDPNYVKTELPGYLDYGFNQIDETLGQVMDAFADHQLTAGDAEDYKQQLFSFNKTVRDSLNTSIAYVTRDVDAYFAKTLKFFGNSYLTLSMISPSIIYSGDSTYDMSGVDVPWLEEHIALKNITVKKDTLSPVQIGIDPAIQILMDQAKGAGFVNADADKDGYRRRVYLLAKYNDKYYGQLVFVPLLDKLGNPQIIVTNSSITLKDAHVGDTVKDIRIPRAQDGSVLIKWPKKEYKEYNAVSAWDLIKNNRLEASLKKNLEAMKDSGFFTYWDEDETPLDAYNNANYIREMLYEGERPDEGITIDTYRTYRQKFIDTTDRFLNGGYEQNILDLLDPNDTEIHEYVKNFFNTSRQQLSDLLKIREMTAQKAKGAFCIIGTKATSTTDEGLTTFQENFPNVGVHATLVNMILSGEFLDDSPAIISILIALLLSIGLGFAIKRLDTTKSMLTGLATLVLSVGGLLVFFIITHRYVGVVVPFASAAATFITLSAVSFLTTIREKSFLRSAFSRYLSPEVITEIINDPSKLNLGGEKRELTAVFTDIRGFSTISEGLDPADLVNLLNMYLTSMSNIVLDNRGTIDKYEGDAIIAFFGAPIHMDEHAALACRTAIQMKKAEAELNKRILAENLSPAPIFTRIGINTGDMIVGNMGTANKMDYTIMGNAVNLAARLEGVNKQYNTGGLLISEHTQKQIGKEFLVRRLDRVRVVGVNTPLRLYELLGIMDEAEPLAIELAGRWEEAIDLYEKQDFEAARKSFFSIAGQAPNDGVATLYVTRCDDFLRKPPATDWDGVFNLTQK